MAYQRTNNATEADIDRRYGPFAEGTFKLVWGGTYTVGARSGQRCVAKEFKTGSVYENHYFDEEMNIVARAQKVIDNWHAASVIDRKILLNTPAIWEYTESRHKVLIEPFIANLERFNSNSGWTPTVGDIWGENWKRGIP